VFGLALLGIVVRGGDLRAAHLAADPYDLAQIDVMDSKLPPGSPALSRPTAGGASRYINWSPHTNPPWPLPSNLALLTTGGLVAAVP